MTGSKYAISACSLTLILGLSACDRSATVDETTSTSDAAAITSSMRAPQPDERVMQMWSQSCALCHVDGTGGAPHVGNVDEWLPRLAQGEDALLTHTLEGLNNMPALGYCMACERDDFLAMINFMTAGISTASNGDTP